MTNHIQFHVPLTRPVVEKLTTRYFRLHRYYPLQSKEGLRFRGYSTMKTLLSPSRLTDSVKVDMIETLAGCRVECAMNLISARMTTIDSEYFTNFLEHFKQAVQDQNITLFSDERYERESQHYTKIYIWVIIVIGLLGFGITWLLKLDYLFVPIVILGQAAGIWAVNRMRRKKAANL